MSFKLSFERLALYNQWMNDKLFFAADKLSINEISDHPGAYFGSVMGTLNHILVGGILWFKRFSKHSAAFQSLDFFRNIKTPISLNAILYPEFTELQVARELVDRQIVLFSNELTDEVLLSQLIYKNSNGATFSKELGFLLQHVFNYQTHHRGQVSTLLNQFDIDIGVTDMLEIIPSG